MAQFVTFTAACLVLLFNRDASAKPPTKIVGGEATSIEEFPAVASLRITGRHFCGGSLITDKHILTAAHCTVFQSKHSVTYDFVIPAVVFEIFLGTNSSKNGQFPREVEKVHVHPGYSGDRATEWKDDIAILQLKEPVDLSTTHQPIVLPSKRTYADEIGYVVGWGYISEKGPMSEHLKKAKTIVLGNKSCQVLLGGTVYDTQLCGVSRRGTGFCDGDSGGPFVVDNEIIGIVSNSIGCGEGMPEIFTRVHSYIDWINNVTNTDD